MHATECLGILNEFSDIFIVNLKTGEVIELQEDIIFALHHINAYENGETIIIDLAPADEYALKYGIH